MNTWQLILLETPPDNCILLDSTVTTQPKPVTTTTIPWGLFQFSFPFDLQASLNILQVPVDKVVQMLNEVLACHCTWGRK